MQRQKPRTKVGWRQKRSQDAAVVSDRLKSVKDKTQIDTSF